MTVAVAAPRIANPAPGSPNVPVPRPGLSWVVTTETPDWKQTGAEIRLTGPRGEQTAYVEGDASVFVPWPFESLEARDAGTVSVRVRDTDEWSDWSDPTPFFASFLEEGEWQADFIGLASPEKDAQPTLLRREFLVRDGLRRATWYATAHGVQQTRVNGDDVDDQILKPGWTPYQFRLVHETTDVTDKLHQGNNVLGVALAGGWYTERFGFRGHAKPFYGEQPSVAGQLLLEYEDGTQEWIRTDDRWRATGRTPWVEAGIYHGEDFDARLKQPGWDIADFDDASWTAAAVRPSGPVPQARTSPEVRVTETLPVTAVLTAPSGETILDFGQNLVGRVRIRVSGNAGETITLRFAEVLENDELGVRPLREARATDTYVLSGEGVEEYAPSFTFHGFRYAGITGWPGEFDPASVTAEVIGSDMRRTGWFETSHELLNRLHENVVWGMRGNFLYVPTDCPQRDERLGWTGDIQIFGPSAAFIYDSHSFLSSWLVDVALEQEAAGGGVAFVVPDVLDSGGTPAAAWGDVATVLPWVLNERYGDPDILQTQYPSMKAWVDHLIGLAGERRLWEGSFQFGDWVDPDAPAEDPAKAKTDPDIVASAFLFHSTTLLARAAEQLGRSDDAECYSRVAEEVRTAFLREYVTPAGRITSDAQTAYALAISFNIADDDLTKAFARRLAWLVRRDGYRISTGFVGTPLVTDALTDYGHDRTAARLLLQTQCPSWLYSVRMGATTIWERWDSLLEDGSINPGEMTSFNHYALGSVADWLHRVVGGIAPVEPGYRKVRIAPHPLPGLTEARTAFEGPYGRIEVEWNVEDGELRVRANVPPNSSAVVVLPGTEPIEVGSGSREWSVPLPSYESPRAPITWDRDLSDIIDDEEAYAALLQAFDQVDPDLRREFDARTRWVPGQPLRSAFSIVSHHVADKVMEELEEYNAMRRAAAE